MSYNKKCAGCKAEKPTSLFNKRSSEPDGFAVYCRECALKNKKAYCKRNSDREFIIVPDSKRCPECKIEKRNLSFNKNDASPDGLAWRCKECCSAANKEYREKNKARTTIIIPDFKICNTCRVEKPNLSFGRAKQRPDGLKSLCKECEKISHRKLVYGVMEEWYQATLKAQGGGCAICKVDKPGLRVGWNVDHEHVEGWNKMPPEERQLYVRGLLCDNCNMGIGLLNDSPSITRAATIYLERYNTGGQR